jgi:hypothetical protein
MTAPQLSTESQSAFISLLDTYDVVLLCQNKFGANLPLPDEIANIKFLIKEFYTEKVDKVRILV